MPVTGGVTYVPILAGATQNLAGRVLTGVKLAPPARSDGAPTLNAMGGMKTSSAANAEQP
jgi:hypothetical protein